MGGIFSSDLNIKVQGVKLPAKVLKAVPKIDARSMSAKSALPKLRSALADASGKVDVLQPATATLQQDIDSLTRKKQMIDKVLKEAVDSKSKYTTNLAALAQLSGGAGTDALGTLLKNVRS